MTPTVTLRPITKESWRLFERMPLSDEQRGFVAPNSVSMVEALFDPANLEVRGIYADDIPVGLTLYGFDELTTQAFWVKRLMISQDHQGKGYGRAALLLVIDALRQRSGCGDIYIRFMPQNIPARRLYESIGFIDTGRIDHPQLVFMLPEGTQPS